MKNMKKLLALILALVLMMTMTACGKGNKTTTDSEYVKNKGKLIVGITEFKPMDYQENGKWVGFDADMATLFAESLGVEAEFVVIDWDYKASELEAKSIDCVWNGMTLTDGVKAAMSTSVPYCKNAQVVVLPADIAGSYNTEASLAELTFAVEAGSAGEELVGEKGLQFTSVADQATALLEVSSGTCDAAVIDLLMAGAMIGEGTNYESLTYTVALNSEEYGVGFRKGSDLTEMLNAFFAKTYSDGTMMELAKTYGVQESVIGQ